MLDSAVDLNGEEFFLRGKAAEVFGEYHSLAWLVLDGIVVLLNSQ